MGDSSEVIDDGKRNRFEVDVEGIRAELVYRVIGRRLVIEHTGVPDELAGRGIGGKLVVAAVNKAVADGLTLVPVCPFATTWLRKHPDLVETVSIDWTHSR